MECGVAVVAFLVRAVCFSWVIVVAGSRREVFDHYTGVSLLVGIALRLLVSAAVVE